MGGEFNPQSHDAMFAKILERMDSDAKSRETFRLEVRARFDRGEERMDAQDLTLAEIKKQTLRTNGRVTRLEGTWKIAAAKIAGGAIVLYAVFQAASWLLEKGYIRIAT